MNTALAQNPTVIPRSGAAEQRSPVQENQMRRYQRPHVVPMYRDTWGRIPSILKDSGIQEAFWFCLCSTKRRLKEIGKGKEAQYKWFGFNIEGDREIPIPRTRFMGNRGSFTRPRCLEGRACWQPGKLKHYKSPGPGAIFTRTLK